jgi:integrase
MPAEIKALVDNLSVRERTLVLLAVSAGLRQSELFGLKWSDIDFSQGTISLVRARPNRRRSRYLSIRLLPMHSCRGENSQLTQSLKIGFSRADDIEDGIHSGDKRFYENVCDRSP